MTILPITYLGSIDYFACLDGGVIDLGENWVKQTARNRCEILSSRGVETLTVPVHSARLTRDVRIDNSKRWQHIHRQTLVSAYRSSPFFDHYEEQFAPLFEWRWEFLADLDMRSTEIVLNILGLPMLRISEQYIEAKDGDTDLRGKKSLRRSQTSARAEHSARRVGRRLAEKLSDESLGYTQVFSDRFQFVGGLSIIDLIFCEGPDTKNYLATLRRPSTMRQAQG